MRFHRNTPRAMGLIAILAALLGCGPTDHKITSTSPSDDTGSDTGGTPADYDADNDGHEHESVGGGDCDDTDPAIYPDAFEICDGLDNDCDGATDEDDAVDASTWSADADGDGFGSSVGQVTACEQPPGYLADDTDCDDSDATVYPGATEICNNVDDDCDGTVDDDPVDGTTWYADFDSDGYGHGAEYDADGSPYYYTTVSCEQPAGFASAPDDCADSTVDSDEDGVADSASINPGAADVCNGIDDDCDGATDGDMDEDGSFTASTDLGFFLAGEVSFVGSAFTWADINDENGCVAGSSLSVFLSMGGPGDTTADCDAAVAALATLVAAGSTYWSFEANGATSSSVTVYSSSFGSYCAIEIGQ